MRRSCTPRLGEFEFGSDSFCQPGEYCGGSPDTPVDLGLQEAVGYCSAQVHRLVDGFQLVVSEADWWWMLLTHQLLFFLG